MRILLVEDDLGVADLITEALIAQHHLVEMATDGKAGWELATSFSYDLILLDLMLPVLDGISFCRQLRAQGDRTPVLLLTAKDDSTNKVMGLDAGADDYVVKPFDIEELLARIRALLRRGSSITSPVIEWEALRLDPSSCEVNYNGIPLHLTAKEYALLELFLRNYQRVFSQSSLLDHLWSFDEPPSENAVRAHIKSLRSKLKKAGAEADFIETVYGLGYRLKPRLTVDKATQKQETRNCESSKPIPHSEVGRANLEPVQSESQLSPQFAPIWERFKDKYSDRITVIEQAITALTAGTCLEELRKQAKRQAHTLIGSLGSFGFEQASLLSRQIEQIFESKDELNQTDIQHLRELVLSLRKELQQPTVALELPTPQARIIFKQKFYLLIVDDDEILTQQLALEAQSIGMQVAIAHNLTTAREKITHQQPDIVLLDLTFPDSAENGLGLLAELTANQPPIPVLVFTAQEIFAERVKVARLGGRGFLQKPIMASQVMEAIAQVVQQTSQTDARLLIVDDDPQILDILRRILEPWGFNLSLLDDPTQFWNNLEEFSPDLLILDVEIPEFSGLDLCQVVRNDPQWSDLPILFLSAHTDSQTITQLFTAGADDYIKKPIVGAELIARVLNRLERRKVNNKQGIGNWKKDYRLNQ